LSSRSRLKPPSSRRLLRAYTSYALLLLLSLVLPRALPFTPRPCGTDDEMRQILGPNYVQWLHDFRQIVREMQAPRRQNARLHAEQRFIIPVVVHIIHDDGISNITDAQVQDGIRLLNQIYQARHPDTAQVIPYFKSRVGNVNVEFRLARLDSAGHCTTGITRHYSTLTNAADDQVKRIPGAHWDADRYMNIWVVAHIASGATGYAYLPCLDARYEGVVVRHDYFGSIGTAPNRQSRRYSLPHEVGHYLGLRHTGGTGNLTGPGLGKCADDDGVNDTPDTEGSLIGTCNLQLAACPGSPDLFANVQNIMDYSAGCRAMFTKGQAELMRQGLAGGFACRKLLVSDDNLLFTGVADGQDLPLCLPVVYLAARGHSAGQPVQRLCPGDSLTFHGEVYNITADSTVAFQWQFPGGQPDTSTAQSPVVTYNTPGTYDVFVRVENAVGNDTMRRKGYVVVRPGAGGVRPPVIADFEHPDFPITLRDPLRSWEVTSNTNRLWEHTAAAGRGKGAIRLQLRKVRNTQVDLVSPFIQVDSALWRPTLFFREAYAPATDGSQTALTISYSLDCGSTWIPLARRTASELQTTTAQNRQIFVPTVRQWRQDSVLLTAQALPAGSRILLRFRTTANLGNAFYLDDIRLEASPIDLTAYRVGEALGTGDSSQATKRLTPKAPPKVKPAALRAKAAKAKKAKPRRRQGR
jgi:PKD repeat protein